MKKLLTILAVLCLHASALFAQGTWTFAGPSDGSGSTGAESGRAICVDASGNTYVTGVFNGAGVATDFDLNSSFTNTFTASTNDGYIASYDKNGNFRWKTIVSGTSSDFLAPSGGICTNGTYVWVAGAANVTVGAAQIMSSTNTVTITTSGTGTDAFVAKMNCSNGSVIWQQAFGGTGANDYAMGICTDPNGFCYVTGSYSTAFTLGSINAPAPGGASDFFIAKFNPAGAMIRFNSGGSNANTDMVNAGGGLTYIPGVTPLLVATGQTGASAANFGSFTGLANSGGNDIFLIEIDTALSGFTNAMVFGSAGSDELLSAVYDPFSGGVFVSGFASGSLTFPGTAALTGIGGQDIVMARYNPATNLFVWSNIMGGTGNDRGWCVTADTYGGILLSGYTASAPCNFGGSVSIATNAGLNDLFVTRFTPAGAPVWVLTAAGAGSEEARSICSWVETTPSYVQNLFITGITNTTGVSFGSFPVGCDGGNDFFVAKLTDGTFTPPLSATQSQVNLTCNSVCNGSATVVASGGTTPYTYSWAPTGGTGATASSLCAGSYTCTITDASAASITKTFTITQPTAIVLNANTQTNVSCFGGANGAASVVAASGGTGSFTYNWTPGNPTGDGTVSVTGLTAGTWTCTATDANGCTATRTFNITSPSAISVTPASQTNVSCFGGSNGAASINTPTGGAGGYTYNWTPGNPTGDGTVSVTGLTAGSWTCTVTDANSCTATQTFNITAPSAIAVTPAAQTNISCFGGSNGAASINTPTGGAGGYTYNWTPGNPTGDGTVSVTGLTAGTWTCTVTDANSCTATQTFNITAPTALVVTPAAQTNVACFGGSTGAASINTPTGGAGGYTYNWTPGNPTGDGTVSVTGLTAGTWTCTVTDANSCTATQTFNITAPSAIVVTPAAQTNLSCFGGSNGAASINTPTGGAGGYTYNWTPGNPTGDGTVSVSGLTAGTWTCTVSDANSCTATQTFNITAPSAITVTPAAQTNIACFGGSTGAASINTPTGGAGGYTYNWTPGNPTGDGTVSVTGLTAGSWTCTVTDANSCTATQTFNITSPSAITVTPAAQTNVSCFGGSTGAASINTPTGGAGGYTYNWTPGNPTGDGTVSVTGLTAGTWTCTVTDANSCTATQTFNITAPTALVVTPAAQTNVACFGGSTGAASINTPTGGTGGYTYNWTPGNPTGDGTVSVTGLTAGTWTCTVTDANSCTATQTFNITAPSAIVVTPAAQTNLSCFGGSNGAASINTPTGGAGGYTYNWTPGNPTGDGTVSVTGLTAGTWTCTVTDANSCTATQTFNITAPSAIVVTPAAQTNIACFGGSTGAASINTPTGGAGGYTYNWTPGNPTGDGTVSVSGLTAGTWTCTVTDANSCTATQTFNITSPTALIVSALSQTNVSCFGGSTGAASVSVSGGTTTYSYNWTPGNPTGDGTASVTGLTAGTWTCTVTDANSCTATQTFNITAPTALVVTPAAQTNVACFGGASGAASINTPTGGAGGYTYNWTPGNPTGDGTVSVTGLTAGTWTCTVTDANSCTATQTFNITSPTAIVVTAASQTNVSCNGGSNGAASINTPTGGAGGFTYNWTPGNPTGDGTVSVSGLTAGSWTCTVTDANSCTATQTFNITAPTAITANISSTTTSCTANTGTATVSSVTGGAGGYTYSWAPTGGTLATATGLGVGTFTCTITDANSCSITRTVNVTTASGPSLTAASQTNIACNSAATGAATVNAATGGAGGYTYNWTPGNPTGDGTVSVSGLTAGTWTCTVTDANGCTAFVTFNITQPSALVVNPASQTNISCFGGSNGAASVTVSGGTTAYSYNWTPGNPTGDGTASVTGLTAGTWTCTVTDGNGCVSTRTFNITAPAALVASALSQTNISCFGGSNGAASVSVSGGTTAYSYNWTPGNPTGDGTASVTGLTAGTWTCTVTDANSCTTTQTFNITAPSALVVSALSQTNISCNGGSNGAASVTVSGGTTAYSYNWTPGNPTGDGTASVTGLTAGTWTCTVTDANSCTSTQTFNITAPSALVVSAVSQTNISCNGGANGAASVSVSGGTTTYSYNWTPGNPTGDGTASVTGLTAGTWTCTVTDANSCTSTQTFNITQPTALVVNPASQTNISCNGGSNGAASVSVTGGTLAYSYNWTPGNPTGDGTASVTGLTAGTWTCTVTDGNGCVSTRTFNITAPSALVAAVASQTNISCNGGSNGAASVSVSGGTTAYSYNWTPGNPTGDGTASVTGLTPGTWTCTVTDANSCTTTQTFNITQPTVITANISSTQTACSSNNGTATVSSVTGGTGGYTYSWAPTGGTAATATGLGAGTYTCTITDANSCVITRTVNVTVVNSPTMTIASQSNITCNGGSNGTATVNAATGGTGPFTYNWTPGNPTGDGTVSVSGLTPGSWTCTVTDANGCTATQTFNITQPTPIVANLTSVNVACNGGNTGSATVSASGGTGTLSYSWAPSGGNLATASNLIAGLYTCTVTDANSCSTTATVQITEPTVLAATNTVTDVSCFGGNNGAAVVTVTGGVPSYTYNWAPAPGTGQGTNSVGGLIESIYMCTITDANGCSLTETVTVNAPSQLVATSTSTNVTCNAACNGTATANVSGGTSPYTYAWSPSAQTTSSITGLCPGTYTCNVTDANGCTTTITVSITEPSALAATQTQTNVSCFGGNNGSASVSVTGGTGAYQYNWLPSGGTNATATGLTAGTYSCIITDANSCSLTSTFIITGPSAALDTTNIVSQDITCFGANNGSATINATGGTPSYSYSWSSSSNTSNTETNLGPGFVTYTITDANGCSITDSILIIEPTVLASTVTSTDVRCFGSANGSAVVTVSGGTPGYTYNWQPSGGTGPAEGSLGPGTYTCTITDANGCTTSSTVTITEPALLTATVSATTNPSACGNTDGMIDITVSGGVTAYTFLWSDLSTNEDLSNVGAGAYSCTITDANGCITSVSGNLSDPNAPTVTLTLPLDTVCQSTQIPFALTGGTPAGGTYSGPGVSAGIFDPMQAPLGVNIITYTFVDSSGCTGVNTDTMNVAVCMGISMNQASADATIYPNPTSGLFFLNLNGANGGNALVEIFAIDGRMISSGNYAANSTINLSLADEAVGVYFVKISYKGEVTNLKVIRQ